jgi:hypothetical protein
MEYISGPKNLSFAHYLRLLIKLRKHYDSNTIKMYTKQPFLYSSKSDISNFQEIVLVMYMVSKEKKGPTY